MGVLSDIAGFGRDIIGGVTGRDAAGAATRGGQRLSQAELEAAGLLSQAELEAAGISSQAQLEASAAQEGLTREGLDILRSDLAPFATTFGPERLESLTGLATDPAQQAAFLQDNPLFEALRSGAREETFRTQSAGGALGGSGTEEILQNRFLQLGSDLVNQQINRQLPLLQGAQQAATTRATGGANILGDIGRTRGAGIRGAGLAEALGIRGAAGAEAGGVTGSAQALTTGEVGAEQAKAEGLQNLISTGATLAALFSDSRLKTNIQKIGSKNGINVYTWDWNDKANDIGLKGSGTGHIAQQVKEVHPELVTMMDNGYLAINYGTEKTVRLN